MNSKLLILSAFALALVSCRRDECPTPCEHEVPLATPSFVAIQNDSPFNGALLVYPCNTGTTNYFGNYSGVPLEKRDQPGAFIIGTKGYLLKHPPIQLPIGTYTMLYWGVPYNTQGSDEPPVVVDAVVAIGANLMSKKISLVSRNDPQGTYAPTYDYVYATKTVDVTNQIIGTELRRVVAGLKVIVANKNGTPLSPKITSIKATIGDVAESLNFFTATPENMTTTVSFPLTISPSRDSATNVTISIFPTLPKPTLTIYLTLDNGATKVFISDLSSSLVANNKRTILVNLNEIIVDPSGNGEFSVDNWNESNEVIDAGYIQ